VRDAGRAKSGADYAHAFDRIYPELAAIWRAAYPSSRWRGADRSLTQYDGIIQRRGVGVIVELILPEVEHSSESARGNIVLRVARRVRSPMLRWRRIAEPSCHAPLVHRSRNSIVGRPIARHDAGGLPGARWIDPRTITDAALYRDIDDALAHEIAGVLDACIAARSSCGSTG